MSDGVRGQAATATAPELLAPAGNWECAKAAVANGADAIYFGLDRGFNARARAANFSFEELPELIQFLHSHRVRGFVTLNTLTFSDELQSAAEVVQRVAESCVDAVLVQDLGLARLLKRIAPELELHASTQMTMTSAECIAVAEELGLARVVLARELSIDEIAKIRKSTSMPLEVFVHGALCVAYSGQCLTSESLGGRSANRGQCAQACRLPYELVCDGEDMDLGDQQYLLSPQDLAAFDLIPKLIDAGVISFKIEGRLKTPEYVANITRHYREAIDSAVAGHPVKFSSRQIEDMELSFSRGFSHGWLEGCDHKELVPGLTSAKQGIVVGEVVRVDRERVAIRLSRTLQPGDGLVFEGDRVSGEEQGGRVFEITEDGRRIDGECDRGVVQVRLHGNSVDTDKLWAGQVVRKNDDPKLTKRLRKSFSGSIKGRTLPIAVQVRAVAGMVLQVTAYAQNGIEVTRCSDEPLAVASKHPATVEMLKTQLGRLGSTDWYLDRLEAEIDGQPMVPLSVLGSVRRSLIAGLNEAAASRESHVPSEINPLALDQIRNEINQRVSIGEVSEETRLTQQRIKSAEIHVLCRSIAQLRELDPHFVDDVYVDFQDIREYREAVAIGKSKDLSLYLATPRIQKPGETGIFRALMKHQPHGILVRNLSGMDFFSKEEIPIVADFSLNAANDLTVDWLLARNAKRVTTSYDLNREQLAELVRWSDATQLEVVIHQHMPMFHMEHCVFCSVLSPGTNKTNCGRPCDVHEVKLRDRTGVEHPLTADVGCRNTLFNATPQSGAEAVAELQARGVKHFRLEFLQSDSASHIHDTVHLYAKLLAGKISGRDVWTRLKAANRVGVTRGTLEERRNPLAII